ncbi:MAG: glycosyl hydrolase, partial [bacterium]|nr:glycosyl hydrolase [bacterium]
MRSKLIYLFLLVLCCFSSIPGSCEPAVDAHFVQPPQEAQPWVYWFWLNGNITREGITADLEAMKRVGVGGVLIMEVDQGA